MLQRARSGRTVNPLGSEVWPVEDIATTRNVDDEFWLESVVDLLWTFLDMSFDGVGEGILVCGPHMFEDQGAREDCARVAHKILEEGIFFAGEFDVLSDLVTIRLSVSILRSRTSSLLGIRLLDRRVTALSRAPNSCTENGFVT